MIVLCLGGWTERTHDPVMLGEREPLGDPQTIEEACDRCCRAMHASIICRLCRRTETVSGLCDRCDGLLQADHSGEPSIELTFFRRGGAPISGRYDGAGVHSRLTKALQLDEYFGFALRPLVGARV